MDDSLISLVLRLIKELRNGSDVLGRPRQSFHFTLRNVRYHKVTETGEEKKVLFSSGA